MITRTPITPSFVAAGQTPFVDRLEARSLLRSRFDQACEGEGNVVLLYGEPGIGKSRLAQAFRESVDDEPHLWLQAGATPPFSQSPFHAWAALLQQLVGVDGEPPATQAAVLAEHLDRAGLDPKRTLPQVAPLLAMAVPDGYPAQLTTPAEARRQLLATLTTWVFGMTRHQPVVILLEDLHWADPSTLELQQRLIEQGATARLLLLYTARPEFVVPWPDRAHVTQLTVSRLRGPHVREMVVDVATRSGLLGEIIDQLVARTDGVPLFVEELTKAVVEAGWAAAMRELPHTLADSLLARIDRLGASARDVVQASAVCGREFGYDLLHGVLPLRHDELRTALQELVRAELLFVRGFPPDATYTFKHALIQDSAYGSLPVDRRRALHARMAAVLVAQDPALATERPEVLAQHHAEAGDDDAAAEAWKHAGERALRRGAVSEAATHLRRGLESLTRLPEGPARVARELSLQLDLCFALAIRHGHSAPQTVAAWERAREIGRNIADPGQLCTVLSGIYLVILTREGPLAARPIADELFDAARRSGSPWYLGWAHLAMAVAGFHAGDYRGAYEHTVLAREHIEAPSPFVDFFDWGIGLIAYQMRAAWHLGRTAEARRLAAELTGRAEAAERPADKGMAYMFLAVFHATMVGDLDAAEATAERGLAIGAERSGPSQESFFRIVRGVIRARQGQPDDGVAMIRSGIDIFVATGQRLTLGFRLGLLVDAHLLAGQIAEALRALEESEVACPGEVCLGPTQLCQRAELLERVGAAPAEIAAAYREGLAGARAHGSLAFELRIAVSYAAWFRDRRDYAAARDVLSPLCARLSEDDDGRDARDARALGRELNIVP